MSYQPRALKIHAWFRKQDRDKNILAGRQISDDELSISGLASKPKNICCRATTSMSLMSCWRPLAAVISV
jgi:(p)ppGpp synthase/HD superfamily hydrolase